MRSGGTIGPLEETALSLSGDPSAPGQYLPPPVPVFLDKGFIFFLTNKFAIKRKRNLSDGAVFRLAALAALSPHFREPWETSIRQSSRLGWVTKGQHSLGAGRTLPFTSQTMGEGRPADLRGNRDNSHPGRCHWVTAGRNSLPASGTWQAVVGSPPIKQEATWPCYLESLEAPTS